MRNQHGSTPNFMLVGIVALCITILLPALYSIYLSFQRNNLIGQSSWIGVENYHDLTLDPLFILAVRNISGLIVGRVVVIALIFELLKRSWQKRTYLRSRYVLLAVAPLPLLTPVGTSLIWLHFTNPHFGFRPLVSIIYRHGGWSSPTEAIWLLYFVDSIHTMSVAAAIGLVIYSLAQNAQLAENTQSDTLSSHPDVHAMIALSTRLDTKLEASMPRRSMHFRNVALLIAAATGLQSFSWSFVITGGGPANATLTPALYLYKIMFQYFELGLGAAIATIFLVLLILLAWVSWLNIRTVSIQLRPRSPYYFRGELLKSIDIKKKIFRRSLSLPKGKPENLFLKNYTSIILLLLSIVPATVLGGPLLWFMLYFPSRFIFPPYIDFSLIMQQWSEFPYEDTGLWLKWWMNGLLAPSIVIWFIQIPIALMTAQGLAAFIHTNRIQQRIVLLPLMAMAFIGTITLSGSLFMSIRRLGMVNTQVGAVIPLLGSALSTLLFLPFFVGFQPQIERAFLNGHSIVDIFSHNVWPHIKPLIFGIGLVSSYWASQRLIWPLISINERTMFPPSIGFLTTISTPFENVSGVYVGTLLGMYLPGLICATILVPITYMIISRFSLTVR